jgi:hypothetical protein
MTDAHPTHSTGGASRDDKGATVAFDIGEWLCLAATPTFAMMALLTSIHGGSMPDILCSAARDASPLTGMVPMYLLMAAFHLAPWLRLLSARRGGAGRSGGG